MKESYGEGVANHTGPESCGATREGGAEALTGGSTGQDIEPRNTLNSGTPTLWCQAEGNIRHIDNARCVRSPARSQTLSTYGRTSHGNREIPCSPEEPTHSGRSGSLRTEADDERTREVGQARSTGEVPEQGRNSGSGGDGGKGS